MQYLLRSGLVAAAIVLGVGVASADSLTYELVAIAGNGVGSRPVGTITFADAATASSYDIAKDGTAFDLSIAGWTSTVAGFDSDVTGVTASGIVYFQSGAIGDAVLIPYQDGSAPTAATSWTFQFDTGAPTGLPVRFLSLYADQYSSGWGWQDFGAGIGEFSDQSVTSVNEWELHLVPEPSSIFLSGLALAGALVWRRRRGIA